MELRKAEKKDMPYLKALYLEAFPAAERAPFRLLKKRAAQGRADFRVIYEDGAPIGMAYVVTMNRLAYLFYYAIDASLRGRGYGTRALRAVIEEYRSFRLFLALEDPKEPAPNSEQRIKRHGFYKNCGLHDLPYHIKEATVLYAIMGTGDPVEPEEYKAMMNRYAGFPMRFLVDMRIIKDSEEKI